jgi:DNA modification methylase
MVEIRIGDCRERLKEIPDGSIDSIVTDPPYELGFMGKRWDASGIAYDQNVWRECLRVLKPGGHLLAFSGSRTYHRMTCAIEDAGFDIRDQIMWVYGSGFPKSLDVSKAIDKIDAAEERLRRAYYFTTWMRGTGMTAKRIDELLGTNTMGRHFTDVPPNGKQPAIATAELFDKLRPYLPPVPPEIEELVAWRTVESENFKKREVVGQLGAPAKSIYSQGQHELPQSVDITAPATPEAKQWSGWGTSLKPAHEPICVARKPLIGTVAENVLKHGTGAINVDGCRVGTFENQTPSGLQRYREWSDTHTGQDRPKKKSTVKQAQGRWPANLIHDGLEEDWARYFYCAKASKRDRDEGCEGLEERQKVSPIANLPSGKSAEGDKMGRNTTQSRNHHPTVKPTDLMRYLCRLVTPPGGLVLDPFAGSGSTGRAAVIEGFQFLGLELSPEYAAIAEARIKAAQPKQPELALTKA